MSINSGISRFLIRHRHRRRPTWPWSFLRNVLPSTTKMVSFNLSLKTSKKSFCRLASGPITSCKGGNLGMATISSNRQCVTQLLVCLLSGVATEVGALPFINTERVPFGVLPFLRGDWLAVLAPCVSIEELRPRSPVLPAL